jgi:hypothetical protein
MTAIQHTGPCVQYYQNPEFYMIQICKLQVQGMEQQSLQEHVALMETKESEDGRAARFREAIA